MKNRIAMLLLIVLCLSVLSGCEMSGTENLGEPSQSTDVGTAEAQNTDDGTEEPSETQNSNINLVPNVDLDGFIEFLDSENFVEDVPHDDFITQIGRYRYEGEKLTDFLPHQVM